MSEFAGTAGSGPAKKRIVCISDTHGRAMEYIDELPDGDVLIHSGDFCAPGDEYNYGQTIQDLNEFFGHERTAKFATRIFVAGNHEGSLSWRPASWNRGQLPHCVYLEDSAVTLEGGLKVYGSPWTNANFGFARSDWRLRRTWAAIPDDTDILVTHQPPYNLMDLAYKNRHWGPFKGTDARCEDCGQSHKEYAHWGDRALAERVEELAPLAHVFGHVHDAHGFEKRPNTLFVNASMDLAPRAIVFDVRYTPRSSSSERRRV